MKTSGMVMLASAACALVFAAALSQVTLVSGDYRIVLLVAIGLAIVADALCLLVFRQGGFGRWVALVVALPSLLIFADFLRRAPYVFDWMAW